MRRPGRWILLAGALLSAVGCAVVAQTAPDAQPPATRTSAVEWKQALKQSDAWYGSSEALRIAENLLLYQRDNGGWDKNVDMSDPLTDRAKADLLRQKKAGDTTIDNGATFTQLTYLARVYTATNPKPERLKEAFLKGFDYLLAAQYPNGGWPQYYPLRKGYYTHITYNDNAMIGVMTLLRDVARNQRDYSFVDDGRRTRAEKAVAKGLDCILKSQVVVDGKPTVWCAQHDEKTLAPTSARAYELASLSGSESVGIVRYLMAIEKPGPDVVRAIEGAVAWLEAVRLTGIKVVQKEDRKAPKGTDRVVVPDASAPPLWARFYEIGTNRPFFCDRDGIKKYKLSEIGYERRNGYAWLGNWAESLLTEEYPAWKAKHRR